MKVTFNTTNTLNQNIPMLKLKNASTQNYQKAISADLPNFNSVGRSMVSFKGDNKAQDDLKLQSKTIEELEELKKLYEENQEEIDKKKKNSSSQS